MVDGRVGRRGPRRPDRMPRDGGARDAELAVPVAMEPNISIIHAH